MKIILIIILLLMCQISKAQIDTTSLQFYPLHTGNIWQYQSGSSYTIHEIIGDTLFPTGKWYKKIKTGTSYYFQRVDSSTCIVYQVFPSPSNIEYQMYDLTTQTGDSSLSYFKASSRYFKYICASIYNTTLLGLSTQVKSYSYHYGLEQYMYELSKGLGETYYSYNFIEIHYLSTLVYAKINNIEYGTFIPTSIENITTMNRSSFILFQNHPNPFNSSTLISFKIADPAVVNVSIFNNIGQKIITLFHGEKERGIHQINFSAGSLSTGIYIYQIKIGNKSLSKKCLIIK